MKRLNTDFILYVSILVIFHSLKKKLAGSNVKICTVVGFPLGANLTSVKAFETQESIKAGADEIDMVINVGWIKSQKWDAVKQDIQAVFNACNGTSLKVILETCLLTKDEIESLRNL